MAQVAQGIIRRRERPKLYGDLRVESPFPAESYYALYCWSHDVWDMLADDLTPNTPESFIAWQESIDRQQNVLSWGVYKGTELGGFIRFIIDPIHPWMGDGHCLFKKDFWGQATTVPALVSVIEELFGRGLQKINMPTFKANHAIAALLKFIGAKLEGEVRRVYMQKGKLIDTKLWGLTLEDLQAAIAENPKLAELCQGGK